jgi:hypothetical protein
MSLQVRRGYHEQVLSKSPYASITEREQEREGEQATGKVTGLFTGKLTLF